MPTDDLRTLLQERLRHTIDDARSTLERVASAEANRRRRFYRQLLNTAFHYTRRSGEFFVACADAAPSPDLAGFYDHLAKEEATHYRLAQRDLEAMGGAVSVSPPPGVARYWERAFDAIEEHGAAAGLGISLLTENVLRGLGAPLLERLFSGLGLSLDQFSFMRVHMVADEDHGREVQDMIDTHIEARGEAILLGLVDAGPAYVGMLDDCVPPAQTRVDGSVGHYA